MRRHWIARVLKIALTGIIALTLFGFVAMGLWNWLMPSIFGLRAINFWQALGLVILGKILFGGFHSHGGRHTHWRRRMQERWEQMTPEEREKFQAGIGSFCGAAKTRSASPPVSSD